MSGTPKKSVNEGYEEFTTTDQHGKAVKRWRPVTQYPLVPASDHDIKKYGGGSAAPNNTGAYQGGSVGGSAKGSGYGDWGTYGGGYQDPAHQYGGTKHSSSPGSPSSSTTKSSTGSKTTYSNTKPPSGCIQVMEADKVIHQCFVQSYDWDWWEEAVKVYSVIGKVDGIEIIQIPAKNVTFDESSVTFFACTYNAAKDYLEALFGRRLSDEDKTWLGFHPYATDDGVPTEYTATCLHGLVGPYGFGVSRMRVRAGALTPGTEYTNWKHALGCNPFALVDGRTTNEEAAAKLGITLAEANEMFRFEYGDKPLPGSVVGERGYTSSSTVQTGSTGGHARYFPPRGRPGDWVVSVQLDLLREIQYIKPVSEPAYHADGTGRRRGKMELKLPKVFRDDGKPVAVMSGNRYRNPDETGGSTGAVGNFRPQTEGAAPKGPTGQGASPVVVNAGTYEDQFRAFLVEYADDGETCRHCTKEMARKDFVIGTLFCRECYDAAWAKFKCPHCDQDLAGKPPVLKLGSSSKTPAFQCPNADCGLEMICNDEKIQNALKVSIRRVRQDVKEFLEDQQSLFESDEADLGLIGGPPTTPHPMSLMGDDEMMGGWMQ